MRIGAQTFETYEQATAARGEFPLCADCGSSLKAQSVNSEWWLLCMKNPSHRGIRTATPTERR